MADQGLFQSQQLKQEQILAPQQIQSLEILVAPLLELQMKVSQELQENPILEQEKPGGEELAGDVLTDSSSSDVDEDSKQIRDSEKSDQEISELVHLSDSWQNSLVPSHSQRHFSSDDEEKRQHFFESLTEEASLQEQLLDQLKLSGVDDKTKELAELIVGSIDEKGYLRSHLADLATAGNVTVKEMEKVLEFVQAFDPPGIAARDLRECLLIQLKARGKSKSLAAELVRTHLKEAGQNKLPQVARKMKISMNRLNELLSEIRALNPYPGLSISPNNPIFVIPEVVVEKRDDKYVVISKDDNFPKLRISQFYLSLLENPGTAEETKDYIKAKLIQGKALIKSLSQRQSTIKSIAEVIVDTQFDFLEKGTEFLRPLTMQQVADKIGVHETTVSRAIANKFMQTPNGLLEFKFFFSTGFKADDGEVLSNRSIMEKIKDFVSREDTAKPMSDKHIAELLQKDGLKVARRTVAKYREELGIQPSHLRKEY
ncbi:MAG TPA: RNA polymerase sigma-54 factor [Lentisphaeria bacterium]|nr:MAG: RNA polymerase sigma-54 factor [Lentisphaerae bacterium GWF2_50_93]HCE43399.1 RNA polymerase sigma-54 factor [Lentisphaeria bacterium]